MRSKTDIKGRGAMIEIRNLSKIYTDYAALENLTLSVARGEVLGLYGPFGSGKSSLLKILATLMLPSRGEVTIDGLDLWRQADAVRRIVGYQPNYFGSYEDMRVGEYLEFFALAYQVNLEDRRGGLERLLDFAGLEARREESIGTLDREARQRLGLVKTLVHDPPILLLDGPAAGLDPAARARLRELIGAVRRMGKTILLGSNILSDLIGVCDRMALLHHGRLLMEAPAEELTGILTEFRIIEVEVQGDVQGARDLLRADPRVRQSEAHGETLIFSLDGAAQDPLEMIGDLRRQGVVVAAYREHEIELDALAERVKKD